MTLPILFQRLEAAALFVAATIVYFSQGFNWIVYILLLFVFDVSMVGYAMNPRVGAVLYNSAHSLLFPSVLTVVYLFVPNPILLGLVCLWFAHVGIDRTLGYGLKLTSGFTHTHLGKIGKV